MMLPPEVRTSEHCDHGSPTTGTVQHDRRPAMGGTAAITVVGGPAGLADRCFARLAELEQAWSRFLDTSDIWRLNWAQGRPVRVRPDTVHLVTELVRAWAMTDGAFDPTILPQLVAAGYAGSCTDPTRRTTLPDTATWPAAVSEIDIDGLDVRLPRGTTLDPGGLGKGLAADMLSEFALDHGADGVLAEVGGDLVVAGAPPDEGAWTVGIEDPFTPGGLLTVVRLAGGAVATSSRLVRVWTGSYGPAHHLIDPATGVNARTSTVTATVVAGTGARAEALTKLAFTPQPDRLVRRAPHLGAVALVLTADRQQHRSVNWSEFE
ncbi:ApbE family lipoprotein [Rhodococcus ruber]|uniref:FAD:protein FMN transferase n=1 Tax=Rhodococcus ruber TaxID=1830 RepID=A0A098BPJ0_9NOCA|nr:Thiamin biosynthesis lipoprotein ApbE [Rhodococcus ruber]CDZ90162.1 ApbE family lipoprotein [Rhodococcus ruber]